MATNGDSRRPVGVGLSVVALGAAAAIAAARAFVAGFTRAADFTITPYVPVSPSGYDDIPPAWPLTYASVSVSVLQQRVLDAEARVANAQAALNLWLLENEQLLQERLPTPWKVVEDDDVVTLAHHGAVDGFDPHAYYSTHGGRVYQLGKPLPAAGLSLAFVSMTSTAFGLSPITSSGLSTLMNVPSSAAPLLRCLGKPGRHVLIGEIKCAFEYTTAETQQELDEHMWFGDKPSAPRPAGWRTYWLPIDRLAYLTAQASWPVLATAASAQGEGIHEYADWSRQDAWAVLSRLGGVPVRCANATGSRATKLQVPFSSQLAGENLGARLDPFGAQLGVVTSITAPCPRALCITITAPSSVLDASALLWVPVPVVATRVIASSCDQQTGARTTLPVSSTHPYASYRQTTWQTNALEEWGDLQPVVSTVASGTWPGLLALDLEANFDQGAGTDLPTCVAPPSAWPGLAKPSDTYNIAQMSRYTDLPWLAVMTRRRIAYDDGNLVNAVANSGDVGRVAFTRPQY